ncbi:MAG: 2-(5''-triphosphoribosyl)-3'-dephosphocoenzyme-A synthase [Enterocloster aldenensis]
MNGTPVALPEMLTAREHRAHCQRELLEKYHKPLICFTMNIAGPVKNNPLIRWGFLRGVEELRQELTLAGIGVLFVQESNENAGNTYYCVVDGDSLTAKQLTVEIEDSFPAGRLFDMDVLNETGRHVDRGELGFSERTCLLCGKPAKECARSRTHTVAELQAKTEELLFAAQREEYSAYLGRTACQSLLYEVCTTPKPGLVDCRNSGSHQDMDIFTFVRSSVALGGYFARCGRIGMETAYDAPSVTFERIRREGLKAERQMSKATGGVNTHKGAIFSVGILCAALGRLPRELWRDPARVLAECAVLTKGITQKDFQGVTVENAITAGQRFFALYGVTGVRGQAESGFPAVLDAGLPTLERGIADGLTVNDAGRAALLSIMVSATDTNLIHRGGRELQQKVTGEVAELIKKSAYPDDTTLYGLDDDFISKNLSPGGSADLLAMTYFLYFLKTEEDE